MDIASIVIAVIEFLLALVVTLCLRQQSQQNRRAEQLEQKFSDHVEKDEATHRAIIQAYVPADKLDRTFQRIFDLIDDFRKEVREEFRERDRKQKGGKDD